MSLIFNKANRNNPLNEDYAKRSGLRLKSKCQKKTVSKEGMRSGQMEGCKFFIGWL